MRQGKSFRESAPTWAAFSFVVLWLGAVAAYAYEDDMNLIEFMGRFNLVVERPFAIGWTAHTPKFLLGALAAYACAIGLYCSTRQNRRPGEEHGSAKWGSVRQLDKKYRDKDPEKNVILTQHLKMGLNSRKHRRNLLQIVVGGSGASKTRGVVKPNIFLANTSYIVTDPKGEVLRSAGPLLLKKGYTLRVFDLIDPSRSDQYNPFHYIRRDSDVFRLIDNFIKNTTPKNASNSDPFWEKSETALDAALMLYLLHEAPPQEQNMEMILTMIEYGGAKEDDDDYQSPLDLLFEALAEEQPGHIAVRQYKIFQQAAGKTAKSILVSAAVRLSAFTLPEIQNITGGDTLELEKLGERKQAIFCVIPDSNDNSLNFLVGMLYTQAFQTLYYQADRVHGGSLPVPVRLLFDEFANVALPDGYARLQATMRSRNVMSTIILQNISQLKELFKDSWEGIIGNADAFVYLGGNEQSTHKYISELLGKETIDTATHSQSKGRNGSYSQNFQQAGRELMTPDEVRMLDNRLAIVLLRGERPVLDDKYELTKHPNIKLTEDGGAAPYIHSPVCLYAVDDLSFSFTSLDEIEIIEDMEETA
ncbi:VirD4-like conjugal transfer protein, CD1115 family [Intestinibacillus massiliensis]|uniref:VirD4-like conjugal transfer protein, CD1115 family n=1 Tax=Intestinibacillus massiliensis TaxID=1871029 RepID=UPI001F1EFA60|nr:type IV secretory system conjugative DNA transfer family protein [Intestinibacillus massiliensis]